MGSKFSGNVRNECRNSHAKFGGAARRRFYAIWKKLRVGGYPPPPSVRGLKPLVFLQTRAPISYEQLPSFKCLPCSQHSTGQHSSLLSAVLRHFLHLEWIRIVRQFGCVRPCSCTLNANFRRDWFDYFDLVIGSGKIRS